MGEFADEFGEEFASFFLRDVAAVFEDDEAGIQDLAVERVAVFDIDDGVLVAPDYQRRLFDEVRVLFEAVGVPVSRCGEDRAVAVCGVERAADRFYAVVCYQVMIRPGERTLHAKPKESL